MFFRVKKSGTSEVLLLVCNRRVEGKTRQTVMASLGELRELERTGAVDRLVGSLLRVKERVSSETSAP